MKRAVLFVAACMAGANAIGAGFDCARASSAVEKRICGNAELSVLDEHLSRYYAAAAAGLREGAGCLQGDQRAWLARRNACADEACLRAAYLGRLAELDALQPGATAIRHLELPATPPLAWVIPPAADKVAAPANPKARPGTVTGRIVDEVANGDGFVLRTDAGERYVLAMLMFLDGATPERLAALAREPQATFTVRGELAGESGRRHFEPSRCTFIHRDMAPAGRIFPDPAKPRAGFKPHELPFSTPQDGVARAEFRSEAFYAVILKTAARCSLKETERQQVQGLFPRNKVFLPRTGCEDSIEENIAYTNVDPKFAFLAVYAGATETEARELLKVVNGLGRFPGANVRRMQAVLVYP